MGQGTTEVLRADNADPGHWLTSAALATPDRLFIEAPGGRSYSYKEADLFSRRLAAALQQFGVVPGDRVAVQVEKSPEALLLYTACLLSGAVFVPLNTAYTPAELAYFLADSAPRLFVVKPQLEPMLAQLAADAGVASVATLGTERDGSLIETADRASPDGGIAFDGSSETLACLLYTSGTTGRSKGAMLTRGNLGTNAVALVDAWRFSGDDVVLHALPIFHAHGLFIAGNTVLAAGATLCFLDQFDADAVITQMARATVFMGVPTHYTRLLSHAGLTPEATATIRLFVSGSAPLLAETHVLFEQRTGHRILERYAMTETVVNTTNPYDGERRPGSVGFPLPGVEIRLTDPESGRALAEDQTVGMIEVRGPNRCAGYWRNPEKTAEDIREDGFFRTGDLGQIDVDGYLHIVGRSKDLIITGGYNVYPIEVEVELDALPGVQESTVIGLAHPDFGEAVTGVVIAKAGVVLDEKDLIAALRDRLARYKQPKRILFVDEFPRNALGKIQKNVLRDRFDGLYS